MSTGKSSADAKPEELEKMFNEHINNFKRLAGEGILVTAGPLSDPNKKLRGIVLLNLDDTSTLNAHFNTDPFVKNGYLVLEPAKIDICHGNFTTKVSPSEMSEFRLVIFNDVNGQHSTAAASETDLMKQAEEQIKKNAGKNGLKLFAKLESTKSGRRALMIVATEKDDEVKQLASENPFVQAQLWSFDVMPIFLSSGVFGEEEK